MAQDYGILITAPGADANNPAGNQIVMDTSNPFIKIDTQNPAGFTTLLLLITNDPTEPVFPATDRYTVVAQFAHGYKYIPSLESLFFVQTLAPGLNGGMQYFLDTGFLGAHTADDGVYMYAVADATNVYIIVDKFNDQSGVGANNPLNGTTLQITLHVFVEDIGV